jgi:hypothetical protein
VSRSPATTQFTGLAAKILGNPGALSALVGFRISGFYGFQGMGYKVQGSEFRVQGLGLWILRFKVQGRRFKVNGLRFRVRGPG